MSFHVHTAFREEIATSGTWHQRVFQEEAPFALVGPGKCTRL